MTAAKITVFAPAACAYRNLFDGGIVGAEDAILIFDTRDLLIDYRAADAMKEVQWNVIRAKHDINEFLKSSLPWANN